jgi:uncharacterized protein (TIGR02145 family)
MKALLSIIALVLLSVASWAQGVGVNETGADPHPSAGLDVDFNNKGLLPPRLTTPERDAITAPAVGLTIYNITVNCLQWWNGSIWYDGCGNNAPPEPPYPVGSVFCASGATTVVDVTSPTTGRIWMDRNLGATQVATSSSDDNSYGDLYQWGRRSDGHQCRTSPITNTLSSTNQPEHGSFINASSGTPYDWRSPQNTGLWQGVNGVNNPCPSGYRIPTQTELDAERTSWSSNNAAGAFASPLKLPAAGVRYDNGSLAPNVGTVGYYWSSTVSSVNSIRLLFESGNAHMPTSGRANGVSVRCIKD